MNLIDQESQILKDYEYNKFQFEELSSFNLENINQAELENELSRLNNAEEIKIELESSINLISDGEISIIELVNNLKKRFQNIARFDSSLSSLNERVSVVQIELKDIQNELKNVFKLIQDDPNRIEEIENLLNRLYSIQKKHQCSSISQLIELRNEYENKLEFKSSINDRITILKKEVDKVKSDLSNLANELSVKRKLSAGKLEHDVIKILQTLGMPDAKFKINLMSSSEDKFGAFGIDQIAFNFSANKGGELRDINKVASGGELSRLMLSLKMLIVSETSVPVLIFDEIDTGVSGAIADKIGSILTTIASQIQVIAITHLPQIACKNGSHLFVYKEENNGTTISKVKQLSESERIFEIAQMLSSQYPTEIAIKNATELLKRN